MRSVLEELSRTSYAFPSSAPLKLSRNNTPGPTKNGFVILKKQRAEPSAHQKPRECMKHVHLRHLIPLLLLRRHHLHLPHLQTLRRARYRSRRGSPHNRRSRLPWPWRWRALLLTACNGRRRLRRDWRHLRRLTRRRPRAGVRWHASWQRIWRRPWCARGPRLWLLRLLRLLLLL